MATSILRLKTELKEHNAHSTRLDKTKREIFLKLRQNDLYRWECHIKGPKNTPYEGYFFKLRVHLNSSYPMTAPKFYFDTKIFHPNIDFRSGEVCLDILRTTWSPVWSIESVCRAILLLLAHPEPNSPLNCDAGNILRAKDTLCVSITLCP